jgi:hypothetical protein
MLQRLARPAQAGLIAVALAVVMGEPRAIAALGAEPRVVAAPDPPPGIIVEDGYELWNNCRQLPGPDDFEFLPQFLPSETPGYIDLNRNVNYGGSEYRALQYTRDKDFGAVRIPPGRWVGGMGFDTWPLQTVDLVQQYENFHVTAWEVDGTRYAVDPSCTLIMPTDDESIGLHSMWVRFPEPGQHSLKIFGRQIADWPFRDPLVRTLGVDPLGLDGRRIFVGESVGDTIDQQFVHEYDLRVAKREDGGLRPRP